MKSEFSSKLSNRFPDIFNLNNSSNIFYFECHEGWFDLMFQLCEELEELAVKENVNLPKIAQVKEKFGKLRIYLDSGTDTMHNRVSEFEKISGFVCEICGGVGKQMTENSWIKTRCSNHISV